MATAYIVERFTERHVKPSTPTPPSLRHHKLCLNSPIESGYIPLVFFYPNHHHHLQPQSEPITTTRVLQTALSKTLSYYYPFAGRLRDNMYIECNDMGAYFSESNVKIPMSELDKSNNSHLRVASIPDIIISTNYLANDPSLLLIKLTYFKCGGMALCICMSLKLGDLDTLFTFYRDWASIVIDLTNHVPTPQFLDSSIFSPLNKTNLVIKESKVKPNHQSHTHLLFTNSKLEELKNKIVYNNSSSLVENPTGVEFMTALLYKCALNASKKVSGKFKPTGIIFTINLRPLIVHPLPIDVVGNLWVDLIIPTPKEEDITLEELVTKIRYAKSKLRDAFKNGTNPLQELLAKQVNMRSSGELDHYYKCQNWCKYPFYNVDFGKGKPTFVYFPDQVGGNNTFLFRDTKDGDGIQVLVSLEGEEMVEFLTNKDLLAFASIE